MNRDYAAWLYGSWARCDQDSSSDIDILAVGPIPDRGVENLALPRGVHRSVSRYSWDEIERMASYGSMFLHHLRLEGRPLLESRQAIGKLGRILSRIGLYTRAPKDIASFRAAVDDVKSSIAQGGSPVFEMSVLATLCRHACILACYVRGTPRFGRLSPIQTVLPELGFRQETVDLFGRLYGFRLHAVRGAPLPFVPSDGSVVAAARLVGEILTLVEGEVNEYQGRLPQAAEGGAGSG